MLRLTFALAVFLAVPVNVAAQETLTFSSQYGPDKPQSLVWERFGEILERERPGAYSVKIVTNGALGGEKEVARSIRLGAITGALSTVANLTTWVPDGAVLDLPFVFDGRAHVKRVLDGPLGARLGEAYRKEGFEVPAFIVFGARHLVGDRPLTRPDDMEGVTMRVLESDLHVALWRTLGANPTAIPITQAYSALSSGVVDAMDMTKSGFDALKLYEVAPVLSETAHIWAVGVIYFDSTFWQGLDDGERALFARAAREAAAHFDALAAAEQETAMARALDRGARQVTVDRAVWRDAVAGFVERAVAEMDGRGTAEALETIRAERAPE